MVITKIALPRRTFIRGMGATLALPLLDAMVPALSAGAERSAALVRRLGFFYVANGANMAKARSNISILRRTWSSSDVKAPTPNACAI